MRYERYKIGDEYLSLVEIQILVTDQDAEIERLKSPWVRYHSNLPDGDYVVKIIFSENQEHDHLCTKKYRVWNSLFRPESFSFEMPIPPPTGEDDGNSRESI